MFVDATECVMLFIEHRVSRIQDQSILAMVTIAAVNHPIRSKM